MKQTLLAIHCGMTLIACSPSVIASDTNSDAGMCRDLSRLYSIEDMLSNRALCPTIWIFYQDRLHDDNPGNIAGPYCWRGLACPGIQLECPYAEFGGEDACSQEHVRDCVLFLRDATINGYSLEEVEDYLRCSCRC